MKVSASFHSSAVRTPSNVDILLGLPDSITMQGKGSASIVTLNDGVS